MGFVKYVNFSFTKKEIISILITGEEYAGKSAREENNRGL
jgi:ABC-type phosphate/phosphonate transport system ATPase subunit